MEREELEVFSIPDDIDEQIEQLAADNGISYAEMLMELIEIGLDYFEIAQRESM